MADGGHYMPMRGVARALARWVAREGPPLRGHLSPLILMAHVVGVCGALLLLASLAPRGSGAPAAWRTRRLLQEVAVAAAAPEPALVTDLYTPTNSPVLEVIGPLPVPQPNPPPPPSASPPTEDPTHSTDCWSECHQPNLLHGKCAYKQCQGCDGCGGTPTWVRFLTVAAIVIACSIVGPITLTFALMWLRGMCRGARARRRRRATGARGSSIAGSLVPWEVAEAELRAERRQRRRRRRWPAEVFLGEALSRSMARSFSGLSTSEGLSGEQILERLAKENEHDGAARVDAVRRGDLGACAAAGWLPEAQFLCRAGGATATGTAMDNALELACAQGHAAVACFLLAEGALDAGSASRAAAAALESGHGDVAAAVEAWAAEPHEPPPPRWNSECPCCLADVDGKADADEVEQLDDEAEVDGTDLGTAQAAGASSGRNRDTALGPTSPGVSSGSACDDHAESTAAAGESGSPATAEAVSTSAAPSDGSPPAESSNAPLPQGDDTGWSIVLPCRHAVHASCLSSWAMVSAERHRRRDADARIDGIPCPVCKASCASPFIAYCFAARRGALRTPALHE